MSTPVNVGSQQNAVLHCHDRAARLQFGRKLSVQRQEAGMFGQIAPTEFDLRFRLLGIPVRVHPVFWLTSAFLAWSSGDPRKSLIRVLCIFVAILVHEMGHALMNRRFGWHSEIVLYFFGGYATSMRHTTWKDIAVSAAGPAAGFALLFAIWIPCRVSGVMPTWSLFPPVFDPAAMRNWPAIVAPGSSGNNLLIDAIQFSLFINFVWNAVNLLPVFPLDGGQISRELCLRFNRRGGMDVALKLSMLFSAAVTAWAIECMMNKKPLLGLDPLFLAIMFGYLCFQSYQASQSHGRGYW